MRKSIGYPGWTLVLLAGALFMGIGCDEQPVSAGRGSATNLSALQGGPMPVREAKQMAQRCIQNLPDDKDPDTQKLRATFEERIVIMLADPDPVQRVEAAGDLGELRRSEAIDALLLAAGDGEPERAVRVAAITSIGWIGDSSCAFSVAQRLDDPAVDVREAAAKTLARLNNPAATPALIQAARDPDARVRTAAVSALGWQRDAQASQAVTAALKDEDMNVRAAAAGALGLLGDAQAVPALIETLHDSSPLVRYLSASALGKLGDAQASTALEPLLKDPDPAVRKAAQMAMGKLKTKNP